MLQLKNWMGNDFGVGLRTTFGDLQKVVKYHGKMLQLNNWMMSKPEEN